MSALAAAFSVLAVLAHLHPFLPWDVEIAEPFSPYERPGSKHS
jgi:hypothetical protein